MQLMLKTILNFKESHGLFVYRDIRLRETEGSPRIEVKIEARKGSQGTCPLCHDRCPGYDRLPRREFLHVPIWGLPVIFLYAMRRIFCPTHGIVTELVPWSVGKSPLTTSYAWFLSNKKIAAIIDKVRISAFPFFILLFFYLFGRLPNYLSFLV